MVYDVWSPMFNQCCETAFFSTKFEIIGLESKTKGWGSAVVVPPNIEHTIRKHSLY